MLIHVGNLPSQTTEPDLHRIFAAYGRVVSVSSIRRTSYRAAGGACVVDMPDPWEAERAVAALHLRSFAGRAWTVEQPNPPRETQADFSDFARS